MIKKLFAALMVVAVVATVAPVQAVGASSGPSAAFAATCRNGVAEFLGFRSWDSCLPRDSLGNPRINSLGDIWLILLVAIDGVMKAAAYVAVGFIIWGGIKYTKSQGDPGELTQARQIIHNALFGLVLVLISIAIVTFIAGAF